MEDAPAELQAPPLLLAGLVGATQIHPTLVEALHDSAMEAAGHRRVKYTSFSYDMRIPPCKRGGKDSPTYRIVGIVKRRWLEKMCSTIPAVLIVCFDWSEDVQVPQADKAQAVAQLQHAQRQARERNLRVLIFVVLHEAAAEAEGICAPLKQQIDTASSGLIVSRGMSGLPGTAQKLERLVYQCAVAFYSDEEKRLRKVWSPKPPHAAAQQVTAMTVRTHFKIGFLSELKRDTRGALMSYIKAYEVLTHTPDVADVVERVALCNFISLRMYQRYLYSHDMQAAVHQCRIHTKTLRCCAEDTSQLAWLKWHWLSMNHQVFAQLLEAQVQQMPAMFTKGDTWQFPGFHYQAAAVYAGQLKAWGRDAAAAGRLPEASGQGGDLVPAPFLGQARRLERPEECADAAGEVAVRLARAQVEECRRSERGLHLLTRAQAAYKERNYIAGMIVCSARMAEEYLEEGNLLGATKLYERLRREGVAELGLWPKWVQLKRFSLERSIFCACRRLGLGDIPSLCSRSRAITGQEDASFPDDADPADCRRQLVLDAFEYLSSFGTCLEEKRAFAKPDSPLAVAQAELLDVVRRAVEGDPAEAPAIEVPLARAHAEVSFGAHDGFAVRLRSPFGTALQVASAVALTSCGELPLEFAEEGSGTWPGQGELELRGAWPQPADLAREDRLEAVRLTWASAPSVRLLARRLAPPGRPRGGGPTEVDAAPPEGGVARPRAAAPQLHAEWYCPVDPSGALASEPFVLHALVFGGEAWAAPDEPLQIRLSGGVQALEDIEHRWVVRGDEPSAFLLGTGNADASGSWELLPMPLEGLDVATVQPSGAVEVSSGVFALAGEGLSGLPERRPMRKGPLLLAVPVVVRCGRDCRAMMATSLSVCIGGRPVVGAAVSLSGVTFSFHAALEVSFEERAQAPRAQSAPRLFTVRALTPAAVALEAAEVAADGAAEAAPPPVLGKLGLVAPGATHMLALPTAAAALAGPAVVALRFARAGAVESFFPWAAGRERLQAALSGAPPLGAAEWPLPREPGPAPGAAQLAMELEFGTEGKVAQPLLVRVRVRGTNRVAIELRVTVAAHGEGGEGGDRYFLSGPTSTQSALLPMPGEDGGQICASFTLVPLRAGVLHLPRVQVAGGEQEIASAPATVFVFPGSHCALARVPA